MHRLVGVLCFVVAPVIVAQGLKPALSDDESALTAKQAVSEFVARKYSGERKEIYVLDATHAGDLEEAFRSILVKTKYKPNSPVSVFKVTEDGGFVVPEAERGPNDFPLVVISSADGKREWVVAVSKETGRAYGLFGFDSPERQFNALLTSLEVHLCADCKELAEDVALLYYRCVLNPDSNRLILNWLDLKQRVERYAYARFPEAAAAKLNADWWTKFSTSGLSNQTGLKSAPDPKGFVVKVPFFEANRERDAMLRSLHIRIRLNGECESIRDELIFSKRLTAK